MKKPTFLFVIVTGSVILLLGSCYYATRLTNRMYEYTTPFVSNDGWEVQAKLDGTWQMHGNYQDLASPYSLLLWIKHPTDLGQGVGSATVRLIEMRGASDTDVTPTGAPQVISGKAIHPDEYFFESQGFDLATHAKVRILLEITLLTREGEVITSKKLEIEFDPVYEEMPSNRILDMLMSA